MDKIVEGRPYGGCAILWGNSFNGRVQPLQFLSNRLCGVLVTMGNFSFMIANVYMPTDTTYNRQNMYEYNAILQEIYNMKESLDIEHIILGGDFNTDPHRLNSLHTTAFNAMLENQNLRSWTTSEFCTADFSFESKISGVRSLIDHFVLSERLFNEIVNADVIHLGDNLSDHCPISIRIDIPVSYILPNMQLNSLRTVTPLWHKATDFHMVNYHQALDVILNVKDSPCLLCKDFQCSNPTHLKDIDSLSSHIVNSCLSAADGSIPNSTTRCRPAIPGWTANVEKLQQDTLFWHSVWKSYGSPSTGAIAETRRRTRALYHKAIRDCKKEKDRHASNSMAASLANRSYKSFWSTVKKRSRVKTSLPSSIDAANGAKSIAELFADKYCALYNSVPYDVCNMCNISDEIEHLVQSKCAKGKCFMNHEVSLNDVIKCVNKLKTNKSDGNEGLSSNHIIHGSPLLFAKISTLSTAMIYHGYSAPNLRMSTIIPIVKNKKSSVNDSGNYRGIALSSILSKLLDIIIVQKHKVQLHSSELQFSYKEKSSTTQCTFVADEVINYYCQNDSNVYMTFLDASKAFDRVKFDSLFQLLLDRDMCPLIARLLAFMYTNQQCKIKWCGELSKKF